MSEEAEAAHVLNGKCSGCGHEEKRTEPRSTVGFSAYCKTCNDHSLHFGVNQDRNDDTSADDYLEQVWERTKTAERDALRAEINRLMKERDEARAIEWEQPINHGHYISFAGKKWFSESERIALLSEVGLLRKEVDDTGKLALEETRKVALTRDERDTLHARIQELEGALERACQHLNEHGISAIEHRAALAVISS